MTEQEMRDREHEFQLRHNVYKIEMAQKILKDVYGSDINPELKDAIIFLERARRENHRQLCRAGELVNSHFNR